MDPFSIKSRRFDRALVSEGGFEAGILKGTRSRMKKLAAGRARTLGALVSPLARLRSAPGPSGAWEPRTPLGKAVLLAGFEYLPSQDIIQTTMENVQRSMGYCRLFDDTAVAMSSVLDSEPILFEQGGFEWMIELWKGQYGIETGCEIGIYRRPAGPPRCLERLIGCKHYACVPNDAMLPMNFSLELKAEGRSLFALRSERHWWLAGFKWGIFTEPQDLAMDLSIDFEAPAMAAAFAEAAQALGYRPSTGPTGTALSIRFESPKSPQPAAKAALRDEVQGLNQAMAAMYSKGKEELGLKSNDPDEIDSRLRARGRPLDLLLLGQIESYFGAFRRLG
jgi:hypothetical protein